MTNKNKTKRKQKYDLRVNIDMDKNLWKETKQNALKCGMPLYRYVWNALKKENSEASPLPLVSRELHENLMERGITLDEYLRDWSANQTEK